MITCIGIGGCSKSENDIDNSITSILSGEYGKGDIWDLNVTVNGEPLQNYDYVRFDSKTLETADFLFVNVIPGESKREFKNIPLKTNEDGLMFSIDYIKSGKEVSISGSVWFGNMSVNIIM